MCLHRVRWVQPLTLTQTLRRCRGGLHYVCFWQLPLYFFSSCQKWKEELWGQSSGSWNSSLLSLHFIKFSPRCRPVSPGHPHSPHVSQHWLQCGAPLTSTKRLEMHKNKHCIFIQRRIGKGTHLSESSHLIHMWWAYVLQRVSRETRQTSRWENLQEIHQN